VASTTDFTPVSIFGVALLLRIVFSVVVYPSIASDFSAGDNYDEIARNLAQGAGYTLADGNAAAERLPLYPLVLAGFFAVFGSASWPWQLAQSAAGALTCVLVHRIAREVTSRNGALVAAAICTVHPALILYTARPLTETLYVLLVVLFVREIARMSWRVPLLGLLLGLQVLIKSTAFLHVYALLPALKTQGRRVFQVVGYAALATAPWVLWNLASFGVTNLSSATGGIALYHGTFISRHVGWTTPADDTNLDAEMALRSELAARGVGPEADIRQRDAVAGELARTWIGAHRGEALRLWLRNLLLTWYLARSRVSMAIYVILHGALLTAATFGSAALWKAGGAARQLAIVATVMVIVYTVFHAAVQPAVRYILPAVPCAALLAAGAFGVRRDS